LPDLNNIFLVSSEEYKHDWNHVSQKNML